MLIDSKTIFIDTLITSAPHRGTKMWAKINSAQTEKCKKDGGFRRWGEGGGEGKKHQFSAAFSEHELNEDEYA